jgi:hypothetical protein
MDIIKGQDHKREIKSHPNHNLSIYPLSSHVQIADHTLNRNASIPELRRRSNIRRNPHPSNNVITQGSQDQL